MPALKARQLRAAAPLAAGCSGNCEDSRWQLLDEQRGVSFTDRHQLRTFLCIPISEQRVLPLCRCAFFGWGAWVEREGGCYFLSIDQIIYKFRELGQGGI
jgi:hypothetical protein